MSALSPDMPLPPLRQDLTLSPGAPLVSGAPSWVIYDATRHRYFQIGARTVEVLSYWAAGTVGQLRAQFQRERASALSDGELGDLIKFLAGHHLLESPSHKPAAQLQAQADKMRTSLSAWLMHRYLFFRVPLVRPEGFLRATWPVVAPLFTRGTVLLLTLLGIAGLYLAFRQSTDLARYAREVFSLQGALTYALALALVKALHELGHAYQAISRGLRVPTMGVAFMVMFPLLYTDVTDAWRLRTRRARLFVDAGGVMVELGVAVLATLAWVFLPDGVGRSAAFALATTSWVLSLFVNLNPFMRFDGYYFLSDALGVQNLQGRSFAMARWWLRELLFGLGDPVPEVLPGRLRAWLVVYGYAVWIYRFFLFLGIALIVYAFFFKALGVLLFVIEIVFFIVKPILSEIRIWVERRKDIAMRLRSWITLCVLAGLVALAFWPMRVSILTTGVLRYQDEVPLFAPAPAQILAIEVALNERVEVGDVLVRMSNQALEKSVEEQAARLAVIDAKLMRVAADRDDRASRRVLSEQRDEAAEQLAALRHELAQLTVTAPVAGRVLTLDASLHAGQWVGEAHPMLSLVSSPALEVVGYISEEDFERLDAQGAARFTPEDPALPARDLAHMRINPFAADTLSLPQTAQSTDGRVPTEPASQEGPIVPRGAWFGFQADVVEATELSSGEEQRGTVRLSASAESLYHRLRKRIARVLVKEMSI
ncbi:MAG: HlyD family efflux transporter periplasmic adaptor subunit [Pseudomonadota bacterium]